MLIYSSFQVHLSHPMRIQTIHIQVCSTTYLISMRNCMFSKLKLYVQCFPSDSTLQFSSLNHFWNSFQTHFQLKPLYFSFISQFTSGEGIIQLIKLVIELIIFTCVKLLHYSWTWRDLVYFFCPFYLILSFSSVWQEIKSVNDNFSDFQFYTSWRHHFYPISKK